MISSKKTEKTAINKIENLLDELEYFDYKFNADDTGISWDGYIDLYHENIDDKGNFDTRIDAQIKGRSTTNKRLQDKWKFGIDRKDLENYNKIDGTLFLAVRFLKNGDYKIYYKSLLPKNITDLLNEPTNSKNEINVSLKEVKDKFHLERICRNFSIDKDTQKKLSKEIFNSSALSIENNKLGTFSTWARGNFNPITILGEEKFIYFLDEKQNIIEIECAEITEVVQGMNLNIKSKTNKIYYTTINHSIEIDGKRKITFGKAFSLLDKPKKFLINLSGTLADRIHQLEFMDDIIDNRGFFIGDKLITLNSTEEDKEKYRNLYKTYLKIDDFCKNHNINKDINIDEWTNKDIKQLLIWIDAIDNNKKINIKEWDMSMLGSIQIKDIRFSIFADKLEDDSFQIYSIWNNEDKNHYQFRYGEDNEEAIYTQKFFSILNKDAYMSDDIDINEMKKFYEENPLEENEETLINFQVLEIIKAYDINGKIELLDYAKYLLNKISIYDNISDIARINYLQIEKRIRDLTEKEIEELIEIRNKNEGHLFNISTNLLIGNLNEAKIELKKLDQEERKIFLDYPISKFL